MAEAPPEYDAAGPAVLPANNVLAIEKLAFVEAIVLRQKGDKVPARLVKSPTESSIYHIEAGAYTGVSGYVEVVSLVISQNMSYRELITQLIKGVVKEL